MAQSGSCIFTVREDYDAGLPGSFNIMAGDPSAFQARLSWVTLSVLRVVAAQESGARLGRAELPPELVFVSFPIGKASVLFHDGLDVRSGDLYFHERGERLFQRTASPMHWGFISLTPRGLARFTRSTLGRVLVPPKFGHILRPPAGARLELLRRHAEIARIARTNLDRISHPEVARALEQGLADALINCLATARRLSDPRMPRRSMILRRFDDLLAGSPSREWHISEICSRLGISQPQLEGVCDQALGMTAGRYQHLRRLHAVQVELLRAECPVRTLATLAQAFGYEDARQLAADYLAAYGELPPLNRSDNDDA